MSGFKPGDPVVAARDIWQEADEDGPAQVYAYAGDRLIVSDHTSKYWPVYVKHRNSEDSFGVLLDEIKPIDEGE